MSCATTVIWLLLENLAQGIFPHLQYSAMVVNVSGNIIDVLTVVNVVVDGSSHSMGRSALIQLLLME